MAATSQTAEFEAAIEAELRDMFRSRDLALYDMMTYHMGWGCGRRRVALCGCSERAQIRRDVPDSLRSNWRGRFYLPACSGSA